MLRERDDREGAQTATCNQEYQFISTKETEKQSSNFKIMRFVLFPWRKIANLVKYHHCTNSYVSAKLTLGENFPVHAGINCSSGILPAVHTQVRHMTIGAWQKRKWKPFTFLVCMFFYLKSHHDITKTIWSESFDDCHNLQMTNHSSSISLHFSLYWLQEQAFMWSIMKTASAQVIQIITKTSLNNIPPYSPQTQSANTYQYTNRMKIFQYTTKPRTIDIVTRSLDILEVD